MILDTGFPKNVAGKVWVDCFIDSLNIDLAEKVKTYLSKRTFKFRGGHILTPLYHMDVPILLADGTVIIDFDIVDIHVALLLGKQTIKKWNLNINKDNDTAHFIINNKKKNVELYTPASGHWCINIQPCLHTDSVNVLFSMKDLSTHEKKIAPAKLHCQYCHLSFAFLKKVISLFNEKDD